MFADVGARDRLPAMEGQLFYTVTLMLPLRFGLHTRAPKRIRRVGRTRHDAYEQVMLPSP
jgi:hypothetical protein